uniref:Uncharacterized protein n=1 Tax=Anguilla anguilla TaxID=7936 RepID=A0A0E9RJ18_ANGAN
MNSANSGTKEFLRIFRSSVRELKLKYNWVTKQDDNPKHKIMATSE